MFIYRFNQLIRSRLLWGFFAIIISFAFVAVGSCFKAPPESVAGKINGKNISKGTYDQIMESARKVAQRNQGKEPALRELDRRAWEQIAAMQVAAENGMTAKTDEVRSEILNMFQGPNGGFDYDRYRLVLRNQGFSEASYERLMGQQILLMKVGSVMESAQWVSPMELDDELAAMTDSFTVQTVTLSNRFAAADMPVTDEDYKAFYETTKESFGLPDRVSVRYISIPLSNYLERVTVSDESLLDFYDAHVDRYQVTDTNNVTTTKPFEEVKDGIFAEVRLEEAHACAETNITFAVFGRRAKNAPEITLEAIAVQEQTEVKTSPLFSQHEPLFWTSDPQAFAAMAFDLDLESVDTRFGIVNGKTDLFVIELLQKSPAHIPPYEEVMADVKQRKQEKARTDAFDSYVKEIRADITKLMEGGKVFEEAARETAQNVSTSLTYTVSEMQSKPFENSYPIAYGAMALKKGDLSEAVPLSAKQAMLIYVLNREQGNTLNAEMMRTQIRSGIMRRRGGVLFNDWLKWNLDQQHFEASRAFADMGDEEEKESSADTREEAGQ